MEEDFKLMDIRASLLRTPQLVRDIAGELPPQAIAFREAPEAWNIFEVLCHLADNEASNWIPRISIILSDAAERRYTPINREAGFKTHYMDWSAQAVLDDFARLRRESVRKLDDFHITSELLERTGIHPEFGPVTLRQQLATWATHDYAHFAQISRLLTRYYGRNVGPWAQYFSLLRDRK